MMYYKKRHLSANLRGLYENALLHNILGTDQHFENNWTNVRSKQWKVNIRMIHSFQIKITSGIRNTSVLQ